VYVKAKAYNANACHDVGRAIHQEWRETNALGGFAASTILGLNTKRNHGLLVAQLKPPLGQYVMLSNVDEILHIDNIAYPLSTRIQSSVVFPEGYQHLNHFSMDPFPTWVFHVEDLVLTKKVIFVAEEQTVLVRYQVAAGDEDLVRLELRPMTAFRHVDELIQESANLNTKFERTENRIKFAGLYFHHNAAILDQQGTWFRSVQYPEDKRLGLDFEEDLYAPFRLMYAFGESRENYFSASIKDHKEMDFTRILIQELQHPRRKPPTG
jgi:predicted glycogen debranching enzyme